MARGKKTGGRDFKPGISGNPNGRPKVPEDVKDARELNRVEFSRLLNQYIYLSLGELKAIAENPTTPSLDIMVIKIISETIKKGDHTRFSMLLDRLIGKVAENVNVGGSFHAALVAAIAERKNGK